MRVFVAGATGVIGQQLVPRLIAAGHEVHGMTQSESKQTMLRELGAVPLVANALDPDGVAEAVARAEPDVIVHQLTAIGAVDPRHMERDFAPTNRLRIEGTDHSSRRRTQSGCSGSWRRAMARTATDEAVG
jgi:nucleoside-diphosphate-sugar epimerase